jgi:hypothetical protein
MASTRSKFLTASVVLTAILYQTFLKSIIFDTMGYRRALSPLSSFNVHCEKIDNVGLESCEDMWLHEPSGLLYMACSKSLSRTQWFPPYVSHLLLIIYTKVVIIDLIRVQLRQIERFRSLLQRPYCGPGYSCFWPC